jgi:hypothetical protein
MFRPETDNAPYSAAQLKSHQLQGGAVDSIVVAHAPAAMVRERLARGYVARQPAEAFREIS